MAEKVDPEATRIVTDHDRIEILAAKHGAAPTAVDGGDARSERADDDVGDVTGRSADAYRIEESVDADDRATWAAFFEWFDDADQVVRYRPPAEGGDGTAHFDVLGSHAGPRSGDRDDGSDRQSEETPEYGTDSMALSDTGDHEPPVVDGEGSESPRTDADYSDVDDTDGSGA